MTEQAAAEQAGLIFVVIMWLLVAVCAIGFLAVGILVVKEAYRDRKNRRIEND